MKNPHIRPWPRPLKGASCKSTIASYTAIYAQKSNQLYLVVSGIKAKFGYWRASKNITNFERCLFPPACLGAANPEEFQGKYFDSLNENRDPSLIENPEEECYVDAGYKEQCIDGDGNSERCRLCMFCTSDMRRSYASPRCKLCPESNILLMLGI